MKIEINNELMDKIKKYAAIAAVDLLNLKSGNSVSKYIADETVSKQMIYFLNKNEKNGWEESNFTDAYLFTAVKNTCRNILNSENNKKGNIINKDTGNLALDQFYLDEGDTIEIEDNELETKEIEEEIEKYKLEMVINTIANNKWIDDIDVVLFIHYFVQGKSMHSFHKKYKINKRETSLRTKKIKHILNYLLD